MKQFSEKFWTPYDTVTTINGVELSKHDVIDKPMLVLYEVDKITYDYEEIGLMYAVELDGGIVLHAFPEEVELEEQNKLKERL